MKNFTYWMLLAVGISLATTASAQPRLAAKAGLNYGGLSGYNDGKKASLHAGIAKQWKGKKKISFQPELLFQRIVQGYLSDVNEQTVENTLSISIVSIPLVVQYYPVKSFFLEAGPQWSVTAGARNEEAGGAKSDVRRNLANLQLGFCGGAGIELKKKLVFYIRYQAGMTDMTLYDADNDYIRSTQAGLLIRLGKK
jgi:hypothetical protein